MILADHAEVGDSKLFINCGGWTWIGPQVGSIALGLIFDVDRNEANMRRSISIYLVDEDGQPVIVSPINQALHVSMDFEVGRPPGSIAGMHTHQLDGLQRRPAAACARQPFQLGRRTCIGYAIEDAAKAVRRATLAPRFDHRIVQSSSKLTDWSVALACQIVDACFERPEVRWRVFARGVDATTASSAKTRSRFALTWLSGALAHYLSR